MAASILLQGGIVLVHDNDDHVKAVKADLLVEGTKITRIEVDIKPSLDTQIFDCTDKIISPGFIDTHHHVWQSLLKGRHANELLLDYLSTGNFTSSLHSPADFFWGQLGGSLEMLDAGTTTVVDHAHLNYSAEHTNAAISATVSSGIRSIFCYCPTPRLESWAPFAVSHDWAPEWAMNTLDELVSKAPFGNGRVELGFAFDGLFLPKEMVMALFKKVKSLGIKLITSHYVKNAIQPQSSPIERLHDYGLLDSSILFSHATNYTPTDARLLKATNSHVSSTPSTELQMALGEPCAFHSGPEEYDITSHCGIGVDCHSNQSASIASELRILLQSSRGIYNQKFINNGKVPQQVYRTVEEAFNLGTIGGARAINRQDELGTLAIGKMADILVWDALSPGMVCAAQHDPVAAIVLHSNPSDIEMVIVNGVIRKRESMLVSVNLDEGNDFWDAGREIVQWRDVSRELVERRRLFQEKLHGIDWNEARNGVLKTFYIDDKKIVDSL